VAKLEVPVVAISGERNTPIEMRDRTVLRADIFRTDSARLSSRPAYPQSQWRADGPGRLLDGAELRRHPRPGGGTGHCT